LFDFVIKHACDRQTDGRTDRITAANTALAVLAAVTLVTSNPAQQLYKSNTVGLDYFMDLDGNYSASPKHCPHKHIL